MSTTSSTPVVESKTARKRKTKQSSQTPEPVDATGETKVDGHLEADGESSYLKELAKQIRNINKKLSAISKTETVIRDFPDSSLDDLLAKKKINADQKAQVLKKPQLEAQLVQLEEQSRNFNDFAKELEARFAKEKAALNEAHQAEIQKLKDEATQNSATASSTNVQEALQIACQFLHAAAYQRQQEGVGEEEGKAYEAVLFHLYQGNSVAFETITNVVNGKDEKITEPSGDELEYTFAQLKLSAINTVSDDQAEPQEAAEPAEPAPATTNEPATDPTIANAGLTELEDTTAIPISTTEGFPADDSPSAAPEQASTTADAANAAAESSWNPEASMTTENTQTGEDWVQVPRDPAETETGSAAPPAVQQSTSNWADEAGAAAEEKGTTPVSENDGFSEVRRDRGGRGRGGRGRGFDGRGRGRGRGRGESRGGRGADGRGRGGQRGGAPQAQAS